MSSFEKIIAVAAKRKGGAAKLDRLLSRPLPAGRIRRIRDDRWLSEMTKCVFQAGFNWSVIEKKWADFEDAFEGFDVARWSMMTPDDLDRLMKSEGIVRNAGKIAAVGENAAFLSALAKEHGSAGAYFAGWETGDYCENIRELQKRGSRLGGRTGQTFLRRMGVDTLVFTPDVLRALRREGVVGKPPGSNRDWAALQRAVDLWAEESGLSLAEISQILAFSVE